MIPRIALATLALAAGCRSQLLDEPDAAVDLAACYSHHHVEVAPLAALDAVDPQAGARLGRAVRIAAGVSVRQGCDLPGAFDVAVQPGNATDFVSVTAHVWRSSLGDASCGPATIATRMLVLSDAGIGNLRVLVGDAHGPLKLTLDLGGFALPSCNPLAVGDACDNDCQCRATVAAARCLPTNFPTGICAVPCSEDADCAAAGVFHQCATGGASFRCGPAPGCGSDAACPFGQRCAPSNGLGPGCVPMQSAVAETPCACDADCGFGGVCNLNVDHGYCQLPCSTGADCPAGTSCVESGCHSLK